MCVRVGNMLFSVETQTTDERTQQYQSEIEAIYKDLTAKGKALMLSTELGVRLTSVCLCWTSISQSPLSPAEPVVWLLASRLLKLINSALCKRFWNLHLSDLLHRESWEICDLCVWSLTHAHAETHIHCYTQMSLTVSYITAQSSTQRLNFMNKN